MSIAYPVSIFIIIYIGGLALALTFIILLIKLMVLSIRALKKYLQS